MLNELFTHAMLGTLLRYWEKKRGARQMPVRSDIDPIEMERRLLPHLMLCDIAEHGNSIRFRLVGTSLVKRLGFDPTGQELHDAPRGEYIDFIGGLLRQVYAEAAPVYGESVFRWGAKGRLEARHLLLPLSSRVPRSMIVLVGAAYSSDDIFPPQIRQLAQIATHRIVAREVLRPEISAPAPRRAANLA